MEKITNKKSQDYGTRRPHQASHRFLCVTSRLDPNVCPEATLM